jgi:membrane protein DedA with SNARE-associated domain
VSGLGAALGEHGRWLIALNVFLQQIGIPLPAEPTLVIAGSLAARGRLPVAGIIGAALGATLVADLTWFVVGKRFGARALYFISGLSTSPEKRLRQIERLLARWGPPAFALAKFIPGLPMVGPVLAGSQGTPLRVFLFYDLLVMSLWASALTALGMVFQRHVDFALSALSRIGGWGLLLAVTVVAGLALRLRYKARAPSAASGVAAHAPRDIRPAVSL